MNIFMIFSLWMKLTFLHEPEINFFNFTFSLLWQQFRRALIMPDSSPLCVSGWNLSPEHPLAPRRRLSIPACTFISDRRPTPDAPHPARRPLSVSDCDTPPSLQPEPLHSSFLLSPLLPQKPSILRCHWLCIRISADPVHSVPLLRRAAGWSHLTSRRRYCRSGALFRVPQRLRPSRSAPASSRGIASAPRCLSELLC